MDKINRIPFNSKANKALELIKEIDDKVVIFTEYRASQMYLQWFYNNTVFLPSHSAVDLNAGRKMDEGTFPKSCASANRNGSWW